MMAQLEFREYMNVAATAIKHIFHEPTDVFWTGKAMDLLFNGIDIHCNATNTLAKLACSQIMERNDPNFQQIGDKRLRFSLLGGVRCAF